jgi:hypothetical protein
MIATIPNTNLALAGVLKNTTGITCHLGTAVDPVQWSAIAADIKNGNSFLVDVGGTTEEMDIKASSLLYKTDTDVYIPLTVALDKSIPTAITPPPGIRTATGGEYVMSEVTFWGETIRLIANRYNHLYFIYETTPKFAVVASTSDAAPDALFNTYLCPYPEQTAILNPRQAYCYVDGDAKVTKIITFPRMLNQYATMDADSTSYLDWRKGISTQQTNATQVSFTFNAGDGTGAVDEIGIGIAGKIVAHQPVTPTLLKDADVDLTVLWNTIFGSPADFY